VSEWQPIETAPKDGTRVLLFHDGGPSEDPCMLVGLWDETRPEKHYGTKWACEWYSAFNVYPICWMPLPPPPGEK